MKRLVPLAVLGASLLAGATAVAGEVTVEVGHNRLSPAETTVQVGDTVSFHNVDAMPGGHTLVADDGSFESPSLEKDQRWSHVFDKAGTYTYRIKEHPDAKGKIQVEPQ